MYMSADLIGRFKVIYALQMKFPNWKITSMPLYSKYDLEVYDENNSKMYIEVKDRWNEKDKYPTAFLNKEKFSDAEAIADNWFYANVYTDGEIVLWKPYDIPAENIGKETKMIAVSTVEKGEKKMQERLCLRFDDCCSAFTNNLKIIKYDDEERDS